MKMKIGKWLAMGMLVATVAACSTSTGSSIEAGPVGAGKSIEQLKGTPCACLEIPMNFPENGFYGA